MTLAPPPTAPSPAPGSDAVCAWFAPTRWRAYLDTASYGLPPLATLRALEEALAQWRAAETPWRTWDEGAEETRVLAGRVLGAAPRQVALLPAASSGVALVAAGLTDRDEVVIPDDEFRSLLLPFLVAEAERGTRVRRVPFAELAGHVGPRTTVVATSHVRSNGGGRQDLEAVSAAARAHGAAVVLDTTHSAGILPVDADRLGIDVIVAAAYKHLLCPRGVAFMRVAEGTRLHLPPWQAGWRAAADPYGSYFGGTLDDLADGAARWDVSLAWHPWVGARESLRTLLAVDAAAREAHAVGLATEASRRLGIAPTGSSVMSAPVRATSAEVRARLAEAGIAAAFPAGQVRFSFHLYNRAADVDALVDVVRPLLSA